MKNIIFVSMIFIFVGLQSCKPRGSSLSTSQNKEELIETQFKTLFSYQAIANTVGLHVNNHPFYRRAYIYAIDSVSKITAEFQGLKKARANNFRLNFEAIKWLASELIVKKYEEFVLTAFETTPESSDRNIPTAVTGFFQNMEDKTITPESLLKLARLQRETAPSCNYTADPMLVNRRFTVCYSFETCGLAINGLKVFTRFSQNDIHKKYVPAVDKLVNDVSLDIQCLVDSETKNLLMFRADTLKLGQRFYKAYKFETFYRPQNNNHGENTAELQSRLRSHIREAEDHFIRGDDPSRVKVPVINALREDLKYKAQLDQDFEKFVHDQDRVGDPSDVTCNDESCENITIKISPEKEQAIESMVDDSAGFAAAAYIESRALLSYIDRTTMNDIRPWLADLEAKATEWRNWRFDFETSGTARPEGLELISPTVAFGMLTHFYEDEAHLPMRRLYLRTMRFMVRNYFRFKDQNEIARGEKVLTDSNILKSLEDATNQYDKNLVKYAGYVGFSGQNLLSKEMDLTTEENGYPEYFHSLMASFNEYLRHVGKFNEAAKDVFEINQQQAQLGDDKLLDEDTNKKIKAANQRLSSHQLESASAALELACLSRGAGEQMQTFYQTQLNEPVMACWKWAHEQKNSQLFKWLMGIGAGSTFEKERGITGNFPLERVCRPPGSGSPISWIKKFQIDQNATETLKCAETTTVIKQEVSNLGMQMALMPLMMSGGGIVTQLIIRRIITARMTAIVASRAGSVLAARITGSATAKGVGAVASDSLILRGTLLSSTQISRIAKVLARRKLADWSSQKFGKIALSASSSFISAAFLTVATRSLFGTLGMQSFVGEEYSKKYGYVLGGAVDWARETMINAAIFMSFGAFHGLSGTGSAALASALPKSSRYYSFATKRLPFWGTVAFFSATPQMMAITDQVVKSTTGMNLELHDKENAHGFYYNLFHSFMITMAFKLHHQWSPSYTPERLTKWLQKKGLKSGAGVIPPSEAEMIAHRAEMMRHARIYKTPQKLSQSFQIQKGIVDQNKVTLLEGKVDKFAETVGSTTNSESIARLQVKEGHELIGVGFLDPVTLFGLNQGFGLQSMEIQRTLKLGVKLKNNGKLDPLTRDIMAKHIGASEARLVKELDTKYLKFKNRMNRQIEQIRQESINSNELKIAILLRNHGTKVYELTKKTKTRSNYLQYVNYVKSNIQAQAQAKTQTAP